METRTPACPIAATRYAPDRAARRRLLGTAAAASLLVHGGLLLAITLVAQQRPTPPPTVQVDEGTPVEVVLEGAAAPVRTALAGASLPLEAMPPAAIPEPVSAAPLTPDDPEAAVDQPPAAATPAQAEPVAALAAEPPPPPAGEPPAPPSLVADAAPVPSEPAPAAPPALVFAESEPARAAPEAPGPALEAGAPPPAAPSFSAPADVAELAASETRIVESTMPDLAAPDRASAVQDAGRATAVATAEPAAAPAVAPIADALPPPNDSPAPLPQDTPVLAALAPARVAPAAERAEPPSAAPAAAAAVTATADAPVEFAQVPAAEPPRPEPPRPEPARPEPLKVEPSKAEPLAAEPPPRANSSSSPTVLAMVAPPASIVPSDPRRGVEDALQSLDCAHVSAKVDLLGGTVTLSGHARSGDDRARLATTIAALPGIRRVDTAAVSVVGEPYCRVLTFLARPEFQRSTEQRGDLLTLGATSGPGTRRAIGGETLAFTMSAPEFDAFLYVDHFSADGRVTHLLPTDRPDNIFKKDAVFRLGAASPLGRKAVVGPPYGLDVVVVVASSEPIFVRPRPASEDANPYLAALDGRLRGMAEQGIRPRLEYAYYLVSTSAPPGR